MGAVGGWGEEELGLEVSEKKQWVIRGLEGAACQGLGTHSTEWVKASDG